MPPAPRNHLRTDPSGVSGCPTRPSRRRTTRASRTPRRTTRDRHRTPGRPHPRPVPSPRSRARTPRRRPGTRPDHRRRTWSAGAVVSVRPDRLPARPRATTGGVPTGRLPARPAVRPRCARLPAAGSARSAGLPGGPAGRLGQEPGGRDRGGGGRRRGAALRRRRRLRRVLRPAHRRCRQQPAHDGTDQPAVPADGPVHRRARRRHPRRRDDRAGGLRGDRRRYRPDQLQRSGRSQEADQPEAALADGDPGAASVLGRPGGGQGRYRIGEDHLPAARRRSAAGHPGQHRGRSAW